MQQQRDYRKEYDDYHSRPEQIKRRADRNAARREALKRCLVFKYDSKEVDHKGYHRTGSLRDVPTQVVGRHDNRIRQPKRS
jgi:hypothetical protein